ncbi:sulfite exporter TauE/SafE family protein [Robertmurraya sp. Marseille-Q9965]
MDSLFFILLAIGIVSAFIGTLAGGGGLITLPAMMLVGVPIQMGIAANKFSSGIAALTSVFYLLKNRHLTIKLIIINFCVAISGGIIGALITTHISEQTMNILAFIILIFALFITLKNKDWVSSTEGIVKENTLKSKYNPFLIAAYDGGFGPGSSTFGIIHYFNQKHTYIKAVQLTRVLILGSCCRAFIIFYSTGFVQWKYAIAMAIGSAVGSQIGLLALPRVPLKIAKSLLITILFLLIGQVVFKLS